MSSGSIAQLIERLVEKDWIQKEIDDTDKRVSHLFLTHNGEAQVEEMRKIFTKKMKNMLSLIPEDDLKEIIRIQENLLKQLKKEKDV
jgi:DNA-binding MarR family transcriptional regulator